MVQIAKDSEGISHMQQETLWKGKICMSVQYEERLELSLALNNSMILKERRNAQESKCKENE